MLASATNELNSRACTRIRVKKTRISSCFYIFFCRHTATVGRRKETGCCIAKSLQLLVHRRCLSVGPMELCSNIARLPVGVAASPVALLLSRSASTLARDRSHYVHQSAQSGRTTPPSRHAGSCTPTSAAGCVPAPAYPRSSPPHRNGCGVPRVATLTGGVRPRSAWPSSRVTNSSSRFGMPRSYR